LELPNGENRIQIRCTIPEILDSEFHDVTCKLEFLLGGKQTACVWLH